MREYQRKEMYVFAKELKDAGFRVVTRFYSSDTSGLTKDNMHERQECNYLWFSLDDVLWGYVGDDFYGAYNYSIKYKPSRDNGSGKQIHDHAGLTVEWARSTLEFGRSYAARLGYSSPFDDRVANRLGADTIEF